MPFETFFYDPEEKEDYEMSYAEEILTSPALEQRDPKEGFKPPKDLEGELRYFEHDSGRGLYVEETLDGLLLVAEGSLVSDEFSGLAESASESYQPN